MLVATRQPVAPSSLLAAPTSQAAQPPCGPAGAELFVAPGFVVPSFSATAAFAAGRLYVSGMQAQTVTHVLSRWGQALAAHPLT